MLLDGLSLAVHLVAYKYQTQNRRKEFAKSDISRPENELAAELLRLLNLYDGGSGRWLAASADLEGGAERLP